MHPIDGDIRPVGKQIVRQPLTECKGVTLCGVDNRGDTVLVTNGGERRYVARQAIIVGPTTMNALEVSQKPFEDIAEGRVASVRSSYHGNECVTGLYICGTSKPMTQITSTSRLGRATANRNYRSEMVFGACPIATCRPSKCTAPAIFIGGMTKVDVPAAES